MFELKKTSALNRIYSVKKERIVVFIIHRRYYQWFYPLTAMASAQCKSYREGAKETIAASPIRHASLLIASRNNYKAFCRVSQTFRYSTNRRRKATKCSAFRIFPGIASCKISSGKTTHENSMFIKITI